MNKPEVEVVEPIKVVGTLEYDEDYEEWVIVLRDWSPPEGEDVRLWDEKYVEAFFRRYDFQP